jgi:hypothetical protein
MSVDAYTPSQVRLINVFENPPVEPYCTNAREMKIK